MDRTGAVLDELPPGPALAAWLSGTEVRSLSEWDLPGVASGYHRLAAWAQARELEAVAEMASRTPPATTMSAWMLAAAPTRSPRRRGALSAWN